MKVLFQVIVDLLLISVIIQALGMEGFQTESGGFVHDKPGVGTTGFQVILQTFDLSPPLISELPITNNGGGKPWNLSVSGAICHRLACNRQNRWDQHILILGLKESGILDNQERLRLKRLGKSWGSKLSRWCICWSSKNGCLDFYMLSRKSKLGLLKNTIWDPIEIFGRPVQILANILGK